ncbi:hypothetical protein VMCG_04790 [Cytospora schulzeri]|uniref:2EXR domain-containing protein n=1 Tax=Cytospora schulzeri TaxID=448051 RepID=A0A423WN06_9PEZI|nr:hypothetical protein VMCG_04790 [Valsa malicola]
MDATAIFGLFLDLPPELRIQIWQEALPNINPALYTYRPGCWEPRLRTESDYDYTPGSDDENWLLEFCHDRLGGARLNIALVSVNREARDVALDWAAKRDVEIRRSGDSQVLIRHFDPERDCMYVSLDDWHAFLAEELEVPYELGWDQLERIFSPQCQVTRLAVPEAFFKLHDTTWRQLDDLLSSFPSVEALYVVSGQLSDMPSPGSHGDLPWRCEIDILQGPEVFWDHENENWLPRDGVKETQNQLCDEVVQPASRELYQGLVYCRKDAFRICKVYLVK